MMRPPQEIEHGTRALGSGDTEDDGDVAPSSHAEEEGRRRRDEGAARDDKESDAVAAGSVFAASDHRDRREEGGNPEVVYDNEEEHGDAAAHVLVVADPEGVSSAPGSPDHIAPGSPQKISAAEGLEMTRDDDDDGEDDGEDDDDFEFPSVSFSHHDHRDDTAVHHGDDGDDDQVLVRRVYPVFDRELFRFYLDEATRDQQRREAPAASGMLLGFAAGQETREKRRPGQRMALGRLMMEEEREPSTSSSEADDLEGLSPESYCLWTPGGGGASAGSPVPQSPRRRKSNSTGGGAGGGRRWRLRDLVIGRSHSDGKKKFLYLAPEEEKARSDEKERKGKGMDGKGKKQEELEAKKKTTTKKKATAASANKKKGAKVSAPMEEVDSITTANHRVNHGAASPPHPPPPPSPPPNHRQKDMLGGLFANVNGATRTLLHPF